MITRGERRSPAVRDMVRWPAARAATVLVVLWLGTAVLLAGRSGEFGPMIAILACASLVLWGPGSGRSFVVGQLVLWGALLAGSALLLSGSASLAGVLALFGVAAAWFVLVEPILRARPPT